MGSGQAVVCTSHIHCYSLGMSLGWRRVIEVLVPAVSWADLHFYSEQGEEAEGLH